MTEYSWPLAALYLRGLERPFEASRRSWGQVLSILRRSGAGKSTWADALAQAGYPAEALLLADRSLESRAKEALKERAVLTAACDGYPRAWQINLGAKTPPAFWRSGPVVEGPYLTVVGSREIAPRWHRFALQTARTAARLGYSVVSGGARGTDRASRAVLEVLPCGLRNAPLTGAAARWSTCAPDDPFTTLNAMERNRLLYALGDAAVVVRPRFREGGAWHGAIDALKARLTLVLVAGPEECPAIRALCALGASRLASPEALEDALRAPRRQERLFACL